MSELFRLVSNKAKRKFTTIFRISNTFSITYLRNERKNSLMSASHSSLSTPATTSVLG